MKASKLSIDFGNTNTVVYIQADNGELRVLEMLAISENEALLSANSGDKLISAIPSEVFCCNSSESKIGKQAFIAVQKTHSKEAYQGYGFNFKKDLLSLKDAGTDSDVIEQDLSHKFGREFITRLCFYINKELNDAYENSNELSTISLSVPVSAPLEYRNWLKSQIASCLNAEKIIVLDEATCAAYYYNETLEQGEAILIVDIGGSTTDFSLVEISRTSDGTPCSRILARHGLRLGGADIDLLIADFVLKKNEIDPIDTQSPKTRKKILRMAEKAKKTLTLGSRFVDSDYDSDLAAHISYVITRSDLDLLLKESHISTSLHSFFIECQKLVKESGFSCKDIKHAAFIGGSFMQPFTRDIVQNELIELGLPAPTSKEINGIDIFYAVAIGGIYLSDVKIEGQCLLNSIFLRTGLRQEVNFKLLFAKGDPYPSSSKDFALGKVEESQTHLKFWLAELDSFQDIGSGASYRPITYNGSFYRMPLPASARAGDYRFITRFHIDEDLRVSFTMFDEYEGVNLYCRKEIGNQRGDVTYIEKSSDQPSALSSKEGDGVAHLFSRESILLSDESFGDRKVLALGDVGQQFTSTERVYSNPSNDFERLVESEIIKLSMKGWLITGATVPGTPWKPDHILILANGVIFVIEDKNYTGTWLGSENGPWSCDGRRIMCGTTKGIEDDNPLREVEKSFYAVLRKSEVLGIPQAFGVATVVAPSNSNIDQVTLLKGHKLIKLDALYGLLDWASVRQEQKITEGQIEAPFITTENVRAAFGISG